MPGVVGPLCAVAGRGWNRLAPVLFRWLASLTDRFFAADHGLVRFRYAARAVLAVALAAATLAALGIPATALLLGCVAAMVCSTSMRAGTQASARSTSCCSARPWRPR